VERAGEEVGIGVRDNVVFAVDHCLFKPLHAAPVRGLVGKLPALGEILAWEKQVLSARGLKRVGRHSEYAI
jgi:hypothetical protein